MDKIKHKSFQVDDPWAALKEFTEARIAMGRSGAGMPTHQQLALNMAHAHARDSVYAELEIERLYDELQEFNLPVLQMHSQAEDRRQYLQRPDLGRKLKESSRSYAAGFAKAQTDVVIIIADGLSATAINLHVVPLLEQLMPLLRKAKLSVGPLCLAEQARVALADDIGWALKAGLSIILIGERPGLSAADSMGAYLTYAPKTGLTDDSRNCISNIRPGGLSFKAAAKKIFYLTQEALRRQLTGVELKDETGLISG